MAWIQAEIDIDIDVSVINTMERIRQSGETGASKKLGELERKNISGRRNIRYKGLRAGHL